jgi:hypothetical protein
MLKYTLKEYKEEFDKKMSEYLMRFEDNTPVSFIDEQKGLFTTYNNLLLLIADKLKEYGDLDAANTIFLPNTIFDGLKKISRETYDDIKIEEKLKPKIMGFQTFEEYLENRDTSSEDYCTRIDYTKLRNHLTSVGRILDFLSNQYLKYQSETSIDAENESPINVKTQEFETKASVDPHKQIIDKHLSPYSKYLSNSEDYNILTNSMLEYISKGSFPKLEKKIIFRQMDKKCIGWALKEIYKSFRTEKLPIELFRFAQQNINLFEKEVIVEDNFHQSSFYKSFTTKPKSYKYTDTD